MLVRVFRPAVFKISSTPLQTIMAEASARSHGKRRFGGARPKASTGSQKFSAGQSPVTQRAVAPTPLASVPPTALVNSLDSTPAITPRPLSPSASSGATFTSFVNRGLLSAETVAALPYEFATEIQEKTLEPILQGKDLLVTILCSASSSNFYFFF